MKRSTYIAPLNVFLSSVADRLVEKPIPLQGGSIHLFGPQSAPALGEYFRYRVLTYNLPRDLNTCISPQRDWPGSLASRDPLMQHGDPEFITGVNDCIPRRYRAVLCQRPFRIIPMSRASHPLPGFENPTYSRVQGTAKATRALGRRRVLPDDCRDYGMEQRRYLLPLAALPDVLGTLLPSSVGMILIRDGSLFFTGPLADHKVERPVFHTWLKSLTHERTCGDKYANGCSGYWLLGEKEVDRLERFHPRRITIYPTYG